MYPAIMRPRPSCPPRPRADGSTHSLGRAAPHDRFRERREGAEPGTVPVGGRAGGGSLGRWHAGPGRTGAPDARGRWWGGGVRQRRDRAGPWGRSPGGRLARDATPRASGVSAGPDVRPPPRVSRASGTYGDGHGGTETPGRGPGRDRSRGAGGPRGRAPGPVTEPAVARIPSRRPPPHDGRHPRSRPGPGARHRRSGRPAAQAPHGRRLGEPRWGPGGEVAGRPGGRRRRCRRASCGM